MPGSERLFNAFWLGAPGRVFFRAAARRAAKRGGKAARGVGAIAPQLANTRAIAPPAPLAPVAPVALPAAPTPLALQAADADRLANLEARLARLERTVTQAG
jgi:hypothetical protein